MHLFRLVFLIGISLLTTSQAFSQSRDVLTDVMDFYPRYSNKCKKKMVSHFNPLYSGWCSTKNDLKNDSVGLIPVFKLKLRSTAKGLSLAEMILVKNAQPAFFAMKNDEYFGYYFPKKFKIQRQLVEIRCNDSDPKLHKDTESEFLLIKNVKPNFVFLVENSRLPLMICQGDTLFFLNFFNDTKRQKILVEDWIADFQRRNRSSWEELVDVK